jgi:hypothetical protein
MTTRSPKTLEPGKQHRRLSTRRLGAFVVAASAPAAAMTLMAPGTAQATIAGSRYFHGCLPDNAGSVGPTRTPSWMEASASALYRCNGSYGKGWLGAFLTWNHGKGGSGVSGDGYVGTGHKRVDKAYSINASCYAGSPAQNKYRHIYSCYSVRSY